MQNVKGIKESFPVSARTYFANAKTIIYIQILTKSYVVKGYQKYIGVDSHHAHSLIVWQNPPQTQNEIKQKLTWNSEDFGNRKN